MAISLARHLADNETDFSDLLFYAHTTLDDLADLLGVTRRTVRRWKRTGRFPEYVWTVAQVRAGFFTWIGYLSTIAVPVIYILKWRANRPDIEHLLVVQLEIFRNNDLRFLRKRGICSDDDDCTIELLESIYNDPEKWGRVRTEASGIYDRMHKLMSLNKEINTPTIYWIKTFKGDFD